MPPAKDQGKIVVVLPAYNAARTLPHVYEQIPHDIVDEVLLVDDGSADDTVEVSRSLGIRTIVHEQNLGYGGNQKTCYAHARDLDASHIIMLHPDGQYEPGDLRKFVEALHGTEVDLILGSRFLGDGPQETPSYKALGIRGVTLLFNLVMGTRLSEVNTGYRAFDARMLDIMPIGKNGNGYIFDPQFLIQAIYFGYTIGEVPVVKRYNDEAISPNFIVSVRHGLENVFLLGQFLLQKWKLKKIGFLTPDSDA
jgi:glycosyltransferase involved in cell wall biosynthesis